MFKLRLLVWLTIAERNIFIIYHFIMAVQRVRVVDEYKLGIVASVQTFDFLIEWRLGLA